jgi:hypothetical protein
MQKASALFLILFFALSVQLFAQDNSAPDVEPDWVDDFKNELYTGGDQIFSISLGVSFPIAFINQGNKVKHNIEPPVGGSGALNYIYYLNPSLFAGAELSLLFFPTVSENTVFIPSLCAKVGTQFIFGKFEFPIYMALGMTITTYLDFGYFGYFMKAGASAFYRANHEWSFGLASNFCWYPQWTKNEPSKNIDALFADLTLVARYHF